MYSSIYIYILPITDISGIGGTCVVWMMKIMKPLSHSLHTAKGVAISCRLCFVFWISTCKDVEDILHFHNPTAKKIVGLLNIYQ